MSSSARESCTRRVTRRQSLWPALAGVSSGDVLTREAGAAMGAAYALDQAISLLKLRVCPVFWQYPCHETHPRPARPAHPRAAAGRCAHLQPGASQAGGPLARALLAAAAPARGGGLHRGLRDFAARAGDWTADPRLRRRVAREPSPGIGAPVRPADPRTARSARVPLDEWSERLPAAHRRGQHGGLRSVPVDAAAAARRGALGQHELRTAYQEVHDAAAAHLKLGRWHSQLVVSGPANQNAEASRRTSACF